MRLILFGAGASYGSERVSPYPPPLGAGLFDDLRRLYPEAWGRVPDPDRPKFVPNFEPGMKALWESGWHGTAALMRCMADYFARFRPESGNSYERLMEHLHSRGALNGTHFSTLNYDCLIEYSARKYGLGVRYFSAEPSDSSQLNVWKVHGSCNFLPASVVGGASAVSYNAAAVKWDGQFNIVDASQVGPFVSRNAFYPAMAVFMQGKPVHSHQRALKQIQEWWTNAVMSADVIGIVGVRPNPDDTHVWDPLAKTAAPVVVIGDRPAYEDWAASNRKGKSTAVIGNRFAASLSEFAAAFAK